MDLCQTEEQLAQLQCPLLQKMPIEALTQRAKEKGSACTHETLAMSVHVERGAVFVPKAAAPCKQPPFPSPLITALPTAFAELRLPPRLGAHQTSSPLWMLLARAQQGRQRRDQHKGVLCISCSS